MLIPDAEPSPQTAPEFRPLTTVRWEAYAVWLGDDEVGFVSRLPEGTWIAYRHNGRLPGVYGSRDEGAAALLAVPAAPIESRANRRG